MTVVINILSKSLKLNLRTQSLTPETPQRRFREIPFRDYTPWCVNRARPVQTAHQQKKQGARPVHLSIPHPTGISDTQARARQNGGRDGHVLRVAETQAQDVGPRQGWCRVGERRAARVAGP